MKMSGAAKGMEPSTPVANPSDVACDNPATA